MNNILEIINVTKTYPEFMLDSININIPYGNITGLIGENGAGKTTLIRIILNQIQRDKGKVLIFGLDNSESENEVKENIGFVFDECSFHRHLTCKNISKIVKHIYTQWEEQYFFKLLAEFKIDLKKTIKEMSKGMETKLMLAVALSHKPRLLILDEVTSGLDPIVRDDILVLLKKYVVEYNSSVFFSTHITSDLDKVADNVAFIHEGKLVFYEAIESLRQDYILIKCSESDYSNINDKYIVASFFREEEYHILVHGKGADKINIGKKSIPSLDDIMLLYIKGALK